MMPALVVPETYVSSEEQLLLFAGACLLGIPCGILFDSMRLLRKLFSHHCAVVAVEDVIFSVLCGFLILGYTSAFARGDFRMYYVCGCFLGFVLYECTLGQIVIRVGSVICRLLRAPILWSIKRIALICRKLSAIFVRNNKKTEKAQKNSQILLQAPTEMVYNKNSKQRKVKQYGKNKPTGEKR